VKDLCHITGGGLIDNLPRILPDARAAAIDLRESPLPPVFEWLQTEARLDAHEMYRTFNCGIGMVVVVSPADADRACKSLGVEAVVIGALQSRDGGEPVRLDGKVS